MPYKNKKDDVAYRATDAYKKKAAARTKAWRKKHPNAHKEWVAKNSEHRHAYESSTTPRIV